MGGGEQHLDEGGFACAIGSEQSEGGSARDAERNSIHGADLPLAPAGAEYFGKTFGLDGEIGHLIQVAAKVCVTYIMNGMRIDSHQHFWDLSRLAYSWMPSEPSPLRRTFLPSELKPILETHRFDGSVVVQAHQSLDEARWLLQLARGNDFIKGVVGWVDLTDPQVGKSLDELQCDLRFKGVRHLVHDEPDPRWLLRPDVLHGLGELERRGIPYDLLLRPVHLPLVPVLAEKLPALKMVIDHIAKPSISTGEFDNWARMMESIFPIPSVHCKLSGMITEAAWHNWSASDLTPYVSLLLQGFGPDRLMFGSDWPVCLVAGTWKEVLAACTQAMGPQTVEVREQILGGTATAFYCL